ncbi:acetyl-CoA C-acetyltransferase, partial [Vibrio parahaemolyticus]
MGNDIWIVSAKRTPIGCFQGLLQPYSAPQLGAFAIQAAMKSLGENVLSETVIDEVLMGCVLPAGCGQAPARQAALGAGLP